MAVRDEQLLPYRVERILFNQVILFVALGNFSAASLCIQISRDVTSTLFSYVSTLYFIKISRYITFNLMYNLWHRVA